LSKAWTDDSLHAGKPFIFAARTQHLKIGAIMNITPQRFVNAALAAIVLTCNPSAHAADAPKPAPSAATPMAASPAPLSALPATTGSVESGLAAVYSDRLQGRKTANGERYDRGRLTAAHKTLAFGTMLKVVNTKNQKTITVRINDRGPTQAGRILDLSPAAARAESVRKGWPR
jgi:rare lipoprotein A